LKRDLDIQELMADLSLQTSTIYLLALVDVVIFGASSVAIVRSILAAEIGKLVDGGTAGKHSVDCGVPNVQRIGLFDRRYGGLTRLFVPEAVLHA
jgi:hypothetical protein